MVRTRSGVTTRSCLAILAGILSAGVTMAQSVPASPSAEQQQAEHEYDDMLARLQQGDMRVDFRAFRVAGALKSGPHASALETAERAAFRNMAASGDWAGGLDSAKRALERNYASPIAQYDAMAAYQGLGKADEAAAHEKILNALLDSIRQSGDGKNPGTAYFVVTVQEEYIFLQRVLHVRATSQSLIRQDGHFYDRLLVPAATTKQVSYLWFNADFDTRSDPLAIGAGKDGVIATANRSDAASASPPQSNAYVSLNPSAYTSPNPNLRVPPNTTILDNFNGSPGPGLASGITYVRLPGAEPPTRGAAFNRKSDSRIEYRHGIPSEGTLEWWINVESGFSYRDFRLRANEDQALIFSTDSHGGDVTWPGAMHLSVCANGDISLSIAASKYNRPPVIPVEPNGTPFRFNSWHAIGVSYGSQGEVIMVDGKVVANAPTQRQMLGAAGNHQAVLDIPTIGEAVSHFWPVHRYDGGFNGTVAMFRASSAQMDWYLARGVTPDFRLPNLSSPDQPVVQPSIPVIAQSQAQESSPHPPTGPRISYPVLTQRIQPEYTPEARAAGLQGSVILQLRVNREGGVEQAQVIQSLGLGLDEKAIEAVEQWRFSPGSIDGIPAAMAQSTEVIFSLDQISSWQIRRAAYRVNRSDRDEVTQLSKPVLNQYASPSSEACGSDGGFVIVNFQITKQGKPDHVRLLEEHGEALGDAALKAIPSWRFRPGLLNGKPREASGNIEMECRTSGAIGGVPPDMNGAYRAGGGVSVPAILYRVEPEYSAEARRAKFQGSVVLSFQVDTSGHAVDIRVARPLGLGLDLKAMEALNQWRFKPATKDGRPVKVFGTVKFNFRLL